VSSDVGVGDSEIATLLVTPADADTEVTLTVTAPDGTSGPVTMTGGPLTPVEGSTDQQQLWTAAAPVVYAQPGRWVLHYAVTGTGQGAEDLEVYVTPSPLAGGPTWWPGRSRVANYVTHRTLARNPSAIVNSQEAHALTFDSTTIPTGIQVDRLIADGAAWVSMRVSPMAEAVQDVAGVVVALYVAAAVERQFPSDERSLERANDIERTMRTVLGELVEANNAANGTDDYGIDTVALWSFPKSDCRWDHPTYW
jgi:hypothetical protein